MNWPQDQIGSISEGLKPPVDKHFPAAKHLALDGVPPTRSGTSTTLPTSSLFSTYQTDNNTSKNLPSIQQSAAMKRPSVGCHVMQDL